MWRSQSVFICSNKSGGYARDFCSRVPTSNKFSQEDSHERNYSRLLSTLRFFLLDFCKVGVGVKNAAHRAMPASQQSIQNPQNIRSLSSLLYPRQVSPLIRGVKAKDDEYPERLW